MGTYEARTVGYDVLARQVGELSGPGVWWAAALANVSAQIMEGVDGLNWAGFYLRSECVLAGFEPDTLVLGPFQGRVACTRIPWGRGVCGTAAQRDETLVVEDVHSFDGHIACDAASRSECVVPLHAAGRVVGVLDLDSSHLARFGDADARGLEAVVASIEASGVLESLPGCASALGRR